jgi:ferrous iron transport protein A
MVRLNEKAVGFVGTVLEVSEDEALEGMAGASSRLQELGFTRGEELRIVGRAPFGEPILVELRGAIMALRLREAKCIKV